MADLPVVLVLAPAPLRLETPPHPFEERGLDCRWYASDADLTTVLARERPDVIASFGDRRAFPRLQAAPYDVRRRWLHFASAAPSPAEIERAGAMVFCFFLHRALAHDDGAVGPHPPLVSITTPTWRTGDRIQRTYRSLLNQSYDHWEWVVVDDSHDEGATLRLLDEIAQVEPRLSVSALQRRSGRIGEVKRHAAALSRGAILVELDHDDELTPNALAEIVQAFQHDADTGFVYSDCALVAEGSGAPLGFRGEWAFGYGRHRSEQYDGRAVLVTCAPPINAHTIRHIVGVPNHVRAWRRDVYWRIGGHNAALHVADDYDLLLRTFLHTRMTYIPKLCYIQHLDLGRSAQDMRRAEIQRLVRSLREHYENQIHQRLIDLGLPDPLWNAPQANAAIDSNGDGGDTPCAPHSLSICCYGARVDVSEGDDLDVCARLPGLLPPEARLAEDTTPDVRYDVRRAGTGEAAAGGFTVSRDGQICWTGDCVEDLLQWLRADIDFQVALFGRAGLFVHAGVVSWRNRAILIPGRSRTGKTRLVEELVRHGARYYSDEYAVLDADGLVHSYARIPSPRDENGVDRRVPVDHTGAVGSEPLPIALVVATSYHEGAPWRPVPVRGGRAVMPLIDNTVLARREPERTLRLAAKLSHSVLTLEGVRPDATLVAPWLLRCVDELLDRSTGADDARGHTFNLPIEPWAATAVDEMTTADVSYVIPTAVGHDHLRLCLESIRGWSPGSEIIVVANGCTPSPDAAILADRVLGLEVNLGFGGGVNRGVLEASRRLVCVMNDDAFFIDATPTRLVHAAAAGKIVGPFSNESKFPQGAVDPRRVPDASIPTDMVVGVCMMMATELFRGLQGFDTRLNTWEDDDICLRARRLGVTCEVVGGAYVHHEGGATFRAQAVDVHAILARNARTFRRMHPTIGVIAIAKDEAGAIDGFYRQFESVTRNWFLLDTGSSDDTREVARRLGVSVATCVFQDFAHARNVALETFSSELDWIVMLDPDERLDSHSIRHLEALAASGEHDVFLAPLRAVSRDGSTRQFVPKPFLFRSADALRWVFKVHEKLIGSDRQALVWNATIDHHLGVHDDARRTRSARFYAELEGREAYFADPEHRARMRAEWPILDYDRLDDERLQKIAIGPLVTVVIPTYRRPALLTGAVRSALGQDYRNLEVIVVGDGCPDLDAMVFDDPRVRILNLPTNHGAGGALPRNYGIMLAAGEIVAYLDDDNEWLPDHVSSIYEAMRAAGAAVGFSSMQVNGTDLSFAEPARGRIDTSCVLHRKSLLERSGWWRSREEAGYVHDWEFLSRVIGAGRTWVCTRKPTLLYNAETCGQKEFLLRLCEGVRAGR